MTERETAAGGTEAPALRVESEIGRLRRVLVHHPGPEIDLMVPPLMHDHLFDDILYGPTARAEHSRFQRVLGLVADEVLDIQDLFVEAMADDDVRRAFVAEMVRLEQLDDGLAGELAGMTAADLGRAVIGGLRHPPEHFERHPSAEIVYRLAPVPNLLFMRDPLAVVGEGAVVGSMATASRQREPLIVKHTFLHHPRLALAGRDRLWFDQLGRATFTGRPGLPTIEGGDVLVLRRDLLAIGVSERTSEVAVEILAERLKEKTPVTTILAVLMPRQRSAMHLDTIFTQISEHEAVVYPPMFAPGYLELLPVVKKDLSGSLIRTEFKQSLLEALRDEGMELEPIFCGGHGDRIAQQREQWTDGANLFCLAPGVVCLYERNERTAAELESHGYEVVTDEELLLGTRRPPLDGTRKVVIRISGHELSRARGGARCMTMPLARV